MVLETQSSVKILDNPPPMLTQSKAKTSVCDLMKDNTTKVIKKMESQIPSYIQLYTDLYTEYLHMFDDLCGACYIGEKQFYEKLGIDQDTIKKLDRNWNSLTNFYANQIEISTNFLRSYVQLRISAIKSYDRYAHVMIDYFAKMSSQYNSAFKK